MQADCLFISGDLFHRQPLVRDLKEVNYLFTTIPNVKVISLQEIMTAYGKTPLF